ncbi:alginate export family protein [Sphingomonas sp. ASV193]|uniref:alginate export family protein n=1 Tax=Sphingomonas sp. ASV193 TaxID=3144405 RepID=UPI0032E8B4FB
MIWRATAFAVAVAVAVAAASPAMAQPDKPSTPSPFRYDDDPKTFADDATDGTYARLKFIPLADGDYLSLGADLRERGEASDVGLLGFRSGSGDFYVLHRLLIFGDLQLGPDVRLFAQLGDHDEAGRSPSAAPTDVDRLDLQQAFIDLSSNLGRGRATLRAGRAEMSFDEGALIGLRDGPNVRQVWDGVRLTYVEGRWRWDAFVVKPVSVAAGVFDDSAIRKQGLAGVHVTAALTPVAFDAFYYRSVVPAVRLLAVSGREATVTVGVRVRGVAGRFDFSLGGIGQTGDLANHRVRAFAFHADAGLTFPGPWKPHVLARADVISGGGARDGTVATFNALYPNVAYSTEATIEAPANLVEVGLVAKASPSRIVTLQYTLEGLWRYSSRDAFYAAPLMPLVRPGVSGDRFTGVEQQLGATLRPNRFLTVTAALVHFGAGDFIRRAGGRGENFGMLSLAVRL